MGDCGELSERDRYIRGKVTYHFTCGKYQWAQYGACAQRHHNIFPNLRRTEH